ncbi:MAG: hypothetical protein IH949_00700 [Bacteroidetes bacterium]|nr:hypothetical protein [Bacteroidota bacterium]
MDKKRKPSSINEILAARKVPKPQFTPEEQAIIETEQNKLYDELAKRNFEELTKKLRPLLREFKIGDENLLAEAIKGIRGETYPYSKIPSSSLAIPNAREALGSALSSHDCIGGCFEIPQETTYSGPSPCNDNFGSPTSEDIGDQANGYYHTYSSLSIPTEWAISIAVAHGELIEIDWPSNSAFGILFPAVHAHAGHRHCIDISGYTGGSSLGVIRLDLTLDVRVGDPGANQYIMEGAGGPGTQGVEAKITLVVNSPGIVGGESSISVETFIQQTWGIPVLPSILNKNFSLSTSLYLFPGAELITVDIVVDLTAWRAGHGFSGLDLRIPSPPDTVGVLPYHVVGGGPVRVTGLSMSFCPGVQVAAEAFKLE